MLIYVRQEIITHSLIKIRFTVLCLGAIEQLKVYLHLSLFIAAIIASFHSAHAFLFFTLLLNIVMGILFSIFLLCPLRLTLSFLTFPILIYVDVMWFIFVCEKKEHNSGIEFHILLPRTPPCPVLFSYSEISIQCFSSFHLIFMHSLHKQTLFHAVLYPSIYLF